MREQKTKTNYSSSSRLFDSSFHLTLGLFQNCFEGKRGSVYWLQYDLFSQSSLRILLTGNVHVKVTY